MTTLVIILLLLNLGFLSYFVKRWVDNLPKAPGFPRGGEKPINEFFDSAEPGRAERRPQMPPQAAGGNEVYEIAEQLLDRIDRKIDILRDLMKQADKKIETLGRTYQVMPAELPTPEPVAQDARSRNRAAVAAKAEQAAPPEDDKRARIMQMRRRGMNASQIAQEIGMGRGEVDLILNIEEMSI